ncbi:hypothetical protein F4775DRAFT_571393 [Biscogniauxia sp. FL1348]|nr:hypothetical protein F4775DRAFT_571393 [Biscogniauxia sp. FL1348]
MNDIVISYFSSSFLLLFTTTCLDPLSVSSPRDENPTYITYLPPPICTSIHTYLFRRRHGLADGDVGGLPEDLADWRAVLRAVV